MTYSTTNIAKIDNTNPSVFNPSVNDTVLRTDAGLRVEVYVTDTNRNDSSVFVSGDGGTTKVQMSLVSGDLFRADTTPANLGCSADASCTLKFIVTDKAGNVNDTTTIGITTDNTNPSVTVTYPNGGEYIKDIISITWSASDQNMASNPINIYYSNDSGTNWYLISNNEPNDGSYSWDTTEVDDGSDYKIRITATDKAGNVGSDASNNVFTIDNTPGSITFIPETPSNNAYVGGIVEINVNATDQLAGLKNITIFVDNANKTTCLSSPCTLSLIHI